MSSGSESLVMDSRLENLANDVEGLSQEIQSLWEDVDVLPDTNVSDTLSRIQVQAEALVDDITYIRERFERERVLSDDD